ncbi:hypothetical protein LXM25_03045 [Dyadobacter sp. LJ53]|uniref:hypothetical protein n=1 Tax=Dyadobacter chenwenxiniae TaxID=2906456 RepID=UPI001F3C076C|nr:hypothetical protein [Dyadobacter chenwenxiniae]MCF0049018.1 hypothetical protein [Dyadobacter chenwenxiniae]
MRTSNIKICLARQARTTKLKDPHLSQRGLCLHQYSFFFILSFTFLLLTIPVHGQGSAVPLIKRGQFRIGLGADYIKTLDLIYSPQMYKSVRTRVQLGYSHKSGNGIFSSDLHVFLGALKPDSGSGVDIYSKETDIHGVETIERKELELSQIGLNLQLGYLHEIKQLRNSSKSLYLGGSLEENLTYTPGFISIGVINYSSLNAKARFDYFLKNGKPVIFELAVPVVSMVTRLPYHQSPGAPGKSSLAAFFTGNNKVETFNHFQNARIAIKYPLLVKKRIALNITYEASWMHYYKPKHLTQAGNQLSLGLTF